MFYLVHSRTRCFPPATRYAWWNASCHCHVERSTFDPERLGKRFSLRIVLYFSASVVLSILTHLPVPVAEKTSPHDGTLIHRHPHLLHHHPLRCCHCQGRRQTAAYHSLHWEGDRQQSSILTGPVRINTSHQKNSIFPTAAGLINKATDSPPNSHYMLHLCNICTLCVELTHIFVNYTAKILGFHT